MCLFNLYRSKKKIIVTGKMQPIGLAAVYVKKFDNCQVFHKYLQNCTIKLNHRSLYMVLCTYFIQY
jgi:hypothetical protein